MGKRSQYATNSVFIVVIITSIVKLFLTKHQVKVNSDNESFMTTSISSQNTAFVMPTVIVISTILMLIIIEKEHKRPLISFNFDS